MGIHCATPGATAPSMQHAQHPSGPCQTQLDPDWAQLVPVWCSPVAFQPLPLFPCHLLFCILHLDSLLFYTVYKDPLAAA